MTDCTENAAPPKSTKSRNPNFSIPLQVKPTSQYECVPRDTEESEVLDMEDFGDVTFLVETVI